MYTKKDNTKYDIWKSYQKLEKCNFEALVLHEASKLYEKGSFEHSAVVFHALKNN